ncbi:5-oxoprolinase subunit PxpB [Mariniflexile aquimaris]|uniref:5-oxoprolinase subunit PxpB n=1 Tax=Mariniflexile aquimaris TaxID=881009 RepID=A0ABW3BT88_9FLAO
MAYNLTYKPFGERSILIEWPAIIDENIIKDIVSLKKSIEKYNIKSIVELKTAYNSLLISYDSICRNFEKEVNQLKNIYSASDFDDEFKSVKWKIPVCYDAVFALDLETISKAKKISKEEIIKRHSQAIYTVYFIGFLPGFLYLGGLDASLYMPRKSTPRLQIEKGSVAIGGNQTGVYPSSSPGGWNIIGNSPIEFFNPKQAVPCFANPLDKIEFKAVSISEYKDIKVLVDEGVYQLESEVLYG